MDYKILKKDAIKYFGLVLMVLLVCACENDNSPKMIELNTDWTFKNTKDSTWLTADVPGEVHQDLFKNGIIKNPFVANNELDLQWIGAEDWEYQTQFNVDEDVLEKKHIELKFNGLDTYAKVYLNDTLILKANNAFRHYTKNVKYFLKQTNTLKVVFTAPDKIEALKNAKTTYELPVENRVHTRKPQFHYGWDWGPIFITSGISKPIELITWDDYRIENYYLSQKNLSDEAADVMLELETNNTFKEETLDYEIYVNNSLHTTFEDLKRSDGLVELPFTIKNPKKWWPHNIGTPYLYDIKCIVKNGRQVIETIEFKKGLRTIELVTEEDAYGSSFYFKVNNVPVYAKGANVIPQHSFQNELSQNNYKKLINDAVEANMNMLRVWGGGIYEEDLFYELCDEKGVLVWQDFMFACAMYPGDEAFLKNVKIEAEQQVTRLRNYSSIALWCGNNENNEAWNNWGWQQGRSTSEKKEIWDNYLKLFDTLLPQTVSKLTETSYWESSPLFGRLDKRFTSQGDAHDWWIWHDEYPFEHLQDNVPRFMSEFGFQAYPSYEAIRYINADNCVDIQSKDFQTHQKHDRGFNIIRNYMQRDFPVPETDEDYVYVSQLLQAYGMTMGFEAQRRAKPYNMGTLYWQLNDCWPVVSWSSIDFMGNWKAMHYKTKHSFKDVLVSSVVNKDTLQTFVINDKLTPQSGSLTITVMDFYGQKLHEFCEDVFVQPDSSKSYHSISVNSLNVNSSEVVVVASFNNESSLYYLENPKNLKLPEEGIQHHIKKIKDGFEIHLTSNTLQKDVFLVSDTSCHFSDNFFDLFPNQEKTVFIKTKEQSLKTFKIKTFNKLIRP
jgi:beta-mannosidase